MSQKPGVETWHDVARIAWGYGGIVAVCMPGPQVKITTGAMGREVAIYEIQAYGHLFGSLRAKGFPLLGATFVHDEEEADQLRPSEFRAAPINLTGWKLWDTTQAWRQIAFAASRAGRHDIVDTASRIASGLRYSEMRLHDIGEAYSIQLRAVVHRGDVKDYQSFTDMNSSRAYKTIHALFWEMAVLRDVLAEFAARFCFAIPNVCTLAGLVKALKKAVSISDPIADSFIAAADQNPTGWMWTFTEYRNFFTHVAPLQESARISMTVQDMLELNPELRVPQIYYPLPHDIQGLVQKPSKPQPIGDFMKASLRRRDRALEPDALEYLHGCLDNFERLAASLVARSPISPQPIHLTDRDFIGRVTVTRK
jgi:hypothetical protein